MRLSVVFVLVACLWTTLSPARKIPILYVFSVVPNICKHGLPTYIKFSLEQALGSQPDAEIILASNFAECDMIQKTMNDVINVTLIDTTRIASARTKEFQKLCVDLFQSDGAGELWMTSATRFFIMEDIMVFIDIPSLPFFMAYVLSSGISKL
jgi:hypothetical protein